MACRVSIHRHVRTGTFQTAAMVQGFVNVDDELELERDLGLLPNKDATEGATSTHTKWSR